MGNMYTNITLSGTSLADVEQVIAGKSAYLLGVRDSVLIFEEGCDRQDGSVETLASNVSDKCRCVALAVLNHDDDILTYHLFRNGTQIDMYNSSPGYWDWNGQGEEPGPEGGDAGVLADAFGHKERTAEVQTALVEEYDFEYERHAAICAALGLPPQAVGYGYSDLATGDASALDLAGGRLVRVGSSE